MLIFSTIIYNAFKRSLERERYLAFYQNSEFTQGNIDNLLEISEISELQKEIKEATNAISNAQRDEIKTLLESSSENISLNERIQEISSIASGASKTFRNQQKVIAAELQSVTVEDLPEFAKNELLTFNAHMQAAEIIKNISDVIQNWLNGNLSPDDFKNLINKNIEYGNSYINLTHLSNLGEEIESFALEKIIEVTGSTEADLSFWNTLDASTKLQIISETHGIVEANINTLNKTAKFFKKLDENIAEGSQERIQRIRDQKGSGIKNKMSAATSLKEMLFLDRVEWYSVTQIINGIKKTKDAISAAYGGKEDQKGSRFAQKLGKLVKYLPFDFAQNAENSLTIQLNEKNDQEINKVKGLYEFLATDFSGVRKEVQKAVNKSDVITTKGLLLYAASRGWLYHIEQLPANPSSTLLGLPISKLFGTSDQKELENILDYFKGENISGFDKEREKAFTRVKRSNRADIFVSELDKELDNINLPAAMGIMKAAVDEGKKGSISVDMTLQVLRKIRNNPDLRTSISQQWLTTAGKDSDQYKSSLGIGLFKEKDSKFLEWLTIDNVKMSEANTIVKIVDAIETQLYKLDPTLDSPENHKEVDKIVSKILTGEIAEVNNQTISIWDEAFDFYRASTPVKDYAPPDVFKEDFGYIQEASGQIIRGQSTYESILKLDGSGGFMKDDYATGFIKKVVERKRQLERMRNQNPAAEKRYNTFLNETKNKLEIWLTKQLSNPRAVPFLDEDDPINPTPDDPNRKMIANLVREGLISYERVLQIAGIGKKPNAMKLAEQIGFNAAKIEEFKRQRPELFADGALTIPVDNDAI